MPAMGKDVGSEYPQRENRAEFNGAVKWQSQDKAPLHTHAADSYMRLLSPLRLLT